MKARTWAVAQESRWGAATTRSRARAPAAGRAAALGSGSARKQGQCGEAEARRGAARAGRSQPSQCSTTALGGARPREPQRTAAAWPRRPRRRKIKAWLLNSRAQAGAPRAEQQPSGTVHRHCHCRQLRPTMASSAGARNAARRRPRAGQAEEGVAGDQLGSYRRTGRVERLHVRHQEALRERVGGGHAERAAEPDVAGEPQLQPWTSNSTRRARPHVLARGGRGVAAGSRSNRRTPSCRLERVETPEHVEWFTPRARAAPWEAAGARDRQKAPEVAPVEAFVDD